MRGRRQSTTPEVVCDAEADHIDRVFVREGHSVSSIDAGEEIKRAKRSGVVVPDWWSLKRHIFLAFLCQHIGSHIPQKSTFTRK